MQFSSVLLAGAALAVAQAAQFTMTASQFVSVKTGTAFDITWSNATGAVTLLLKNGASNDLKTVATIGSMGITQLIDFEADFRRRLDWNFIQLDSRFHAR
jgi:hypothetical protein